MSLNRVLRSSIWLYVSSVASSFIGFLFWLLASSFVPPSTIGDAAFIIGIVTLATSIFSFGAYSGATRLFGKAFGHNDQRLLNSYFVSILALMLSIYSIVALLTFLFGSFVGTTRLDIVFMSVLIILGGWPSILTSLYNSILRTNVIALASILANIFKLVLGLVLLYIGWDFIGVMTAFVIFSLSQDLILIAMLRGSVSPSRPSLVSAKAVLKAGIPDYIPGLVATAGTWLGILGIYGFSGGTQTGTYYIGFQISLLVYSIPISLLGLMFPVLSGMEDGRKRAINNAIRLSFATTVPLAALGMAYAYVPLSLLGSSYVATSLTLQILMIGCLIAPITSGFYSLIYAYGNYRYVTLLGLSLNIPRVVLYPFLVAMWGDNGAAVAYVSGFFFALAAVIVMSRRINYSIGWKPSLELILIPLAITSIVYIGNLHWILGTTIILGVTIVAYARLGLIRRADLAEISGAFISRERLDRDVPLLRYLLRVLYGE
jgi:O-antigen/teichoic acid export membrane protein